MWGREQQHFEEKQIKHDMFWLHWYTIWAHFWRREVWPIGEVKIPEPGTLYIARVLGFQSIHSHCDLEHNSSTSTSTNEENCLLTTLKTYTLVYTCLANIFSFLYLPDSLGKASIFNKLFWTNQLSYSNLTGQVLT